MKRILLTCILYVSIMMNAQAQRFCIVDMDYILSNIPQYEEAQETVNSLANQWKAEIDQMVRLPGGEGAIPVVLVGNKVGTNALIHRKNDEGVLLSPVSCFS